MSDALGNTYQVYAIQIESPKSSLIFIHQHCTPSEMIKFFLKRVQILTLYPSCTQIYIFTFYNPALSPISQLTGMIFNKIHLLGLPNQYYTIV